MFETVKAKKYIRQIEKAAKSSARSIVATVLLRPASTEEVAGDSMHCIGSFFNENREFVEFEFMFFFYFVYDYRVYHKLKPELRKAICDLFADKLCNIRKSSLSNKAFDELFDNRMDAFLAFIQESKTVGDFLDMASDYMNALLTISIDENGYANGSLGDLPTIKGAIKPNIFTTLIKKALSLHSHTLL